MIHEALLAQNAEVNHIPLHRQVIPWASRSNVTVPHRADNWVMPYWVTRAVAAARRAFGARQRTPTTPRRASSAMVASAKPRRSPRTSAVCSPSSGGARP